MRPGSWPPSPGFEPWAILISSWSARARYVAVTPNRADATCLIRASWRRPSASGRVPGRVLAALAGVRGAAGPLDPDRQRLVGLGAQRADAHRRDDEAAHDRARVLDLVERRRRPRVGGRAARRAGPRGRRRSAGRARPGSAPAAASMSRLAVAAVSRRAPGSRRRSAARTGAPRHRPGTARSPDRAAAARDRRRRRDGERGVAAAELARRRGRRTSSGPARRRPSGSSARRPRASRSSVVDERPADVRRDGADPHPGERLAQAGLEGGRPGCRRSSAGVSVLGAARARQLGGELDREPRMDGGRADRERPSPSAWTSRTSAASTTRSVRPRRPASVSAVWTAPAARIDGIGSRSSDQAAVGEDEDLRAAARRPRPASRASRSSAPARPAGPVGGGPGRVERRGRAGRRRRARRAGRRGRRRSAGARRSGPRAARRPAEQRRPPAELDPQVHHDPLALGVDRRVRDLGERLAEVVGDRPVEPRRDRASACRRPCSTAARGASRAIVLMSSRARSASSPAR